MMATVKTTSLVIETTTATTMAAEEIEAAMALAKPGGNGDS